MQSLTEFLLFYSLFLFFIHFLLNHSEILNKPREILMPLLPNLISYIIQCPLCLTFWTTLIMWWITGLSVYYVVAAPPVVLFLDLIYRKLK